MTYETFQVGQTVILQRTTHYGSVRGTILRVRSGSMLKVTHVLKIPEYQVEWREAGKTWRRWLYPMRLESISPLETLAEAAE